MRARGAAFGAWLLLAPTHALAAPPVAPHTCTVSGDLPDGAYSVHRYVPQRVPRRYRATLTLVDSLDQAEPYVWESFGYGPRAHVAQGSVSWPSDVAPLHRPLLLCIEEAGGERDLRLTITGPPGGCTARVKPVPTQRSCAARIGPVPTHLGLDAPAGG